MCAALLGKGPAQKGEVADQKPKVDQIVRICVLPTESADLWNGSLVIHGKVLVPGVAFAMKGAIKLGHRCVVEFRDTPSMFAL